MTEWIDKAAKQVMRYVCARHGNAVDGASADELFCESAIEEIIREAYAAREQHEYNQLGGSAYGRCNIHQVPLIHTITEKTYCAVCVDVEREKLEQQLADLERQYDRFEQIIQDADAQAYKLRELLDGKSPGRTVFAEMLVCLPEMVTQVQAMREQLATAHARCAAMQAAKKEQD